MLGLASFARMGEMHCTRDMTISGVIAADGDIVRLDAPLPARCGDRVCYGLLADGTPVAFIGSDTPMFEQIWADQQTWQPDVIGVAASDDAKLSTASAVDTEPISISGLRLLSTNDSITIDTEVADHRGFLSLNVTANVINLTVNVVASPSSVRRGRCRNQRPATDPTASLGLTAQSAAPSPRRCGGTQRSHAS